jgi:hypothetical protein
MIGTLVDFVIHTRMSTDSSVGFREQWVNTGNGFVKQTFADGTTKLMMQTVDASNAGGPNYSKVQLYFTTTRSYRRTTRRGPPRSTSRATGSARGSTPSRHARTAERLAR